MHTFGRLSPRAPSTAAVTALVERGRGLAALLARRDARTPFALSLVALSLMRAVPPPEEAERASLRTIRSGLDYARGRKDLLGTYLVDFWAMFFGLPYALFPQLAAKLGGPSALGVLYAAPAAGALLVNLTSGWTHRVRRPGRSIVIAVIVWRCAIGALGLARDLALAAAALVVSGCADMVSGLFRMTIWNQSIPDEMRGRLAGIEMISYTAGWPLGNLEAGVADSLAGLRNAIVSGGLLCLASTALVVLVLPALWRYDSALVRGPVRDTG